MVETTVSELIGQLKEIQDEHGPETPVAMRQTADEGEYGTVEWMSTGIVVVEYNERADQVEVK